MKRHTKAQRHVSRAHFAITPLAGIVLAALAAHANAITLSPPAPLPLTGDTFGGLGFLSGGSSSYALGISADGTVVTGYGRSSYPNEAFIWSGNTFTGLGILPGGSLSLAFAISGDGSTVVGAGTSTTGTQAFRWTQATGMVGLGYLAGGVGSWARAASYDGSVVAGYGKDSAGNSQAFRWTQATGLVGLGYLAGGVSSQAMGISGDGSVIVGANIDSGGNAQAFRWTQAGGMVGLGFLAGDNYSQALAVSADGSVITGYDNDINGDSQAFRWTQATGMVGLGFLAGGIYSQAYAISGDGNVIVGTADDGTAMVAFRWTQATGMQSVSGWLAGAGVAVPAGWTLSNATGVSANGNVVVGYGTDPNNYTEAWLARVNPTTGTAGLLTNVAAFNDTLVESGSRAVQAGVGLPDLAMFGVHHRTLFDSGLARTADGSCAWATSDAARNDRTNTRMALAEAGVCRDIGSARVGAGVGQAWTRQDWSLGGGAKYDGQYLVAEADNAFGGGLEGSVTGYYGRFDARFDRNYMNGANVDTSRGTSDATSTALRARVDWKNLASLGSFRVSPYAAWTWSETRLDAYTETGGGFPAQFGAATWRTDDIRVGAAMTRALSAAADLRLGLEAAHRLDSTTSGVSGQVIGLWSFSLPGQGIDQTWARATVDFDYRLSRAVALTFGANGATAGGDATWGLTAGVHASF